MERSVITREEAKARGLKRYFTGVPCKRDHTVERYAVNEDCVECNKLHGFQRYHRNPERHRRKIHIYRQTPHAKEVERSRNQRVIERLAIARKNPFTSANALLLARYMVRSSKQRAKHRNIPHTLTPEDLLPLPTHCPVLGMILSYDSGQGDRNSQASLDEILVGEGYVPGNVAVISMRANTLKSNMMREESEKIYRYIEGGVK